MSEEEQIAAHRLGITCPVCGRSASFDVDEMEWRCKPCAVYVETDVELED